MRVSAKFHNDDGLEYTVEADCLWDRDAQEIRICGQVVLADDLDWEDLEKYHRNCIEDSLADAWEAAMDAAVGVAA